MKTIKNTLTDANFLFNALKYGFLSLIAFTIVNMIIHIAKNPEVLKYAF